LKKIILLIILLAVAGCFGGYEDEGKIGIIEGYVIDIISGETVADTVVKVQDISYITASDGYFPLSRSGDDPYIIPKESGDSYRIDNEAYYLKTGVTRLSYGQKNLMAFITPKPIVREGEMEPKKFSVAGEIYSEGTGTLLRGATVVINGVFTEIPYMEVLDSNSSFLISNIPESKINVYVFKDGYDSYSKVIDLNEDKLDLLIYLRENSSKEYGTLNGQITGYNNEACGHSIISWGQKGSNRYQFTMTDTFGNYTLYGLPVGLNQITVKSPGFYNSSPASENQIEISAGEISLHNVKMEYIKGDE